LLEKSLVSDSILGPQTQKILHSIVCVCLFFVIYEDRNFYNDMDITLVLQYERDLWGRLNGLKNILNCFIKNVKMHKVFCDG